MQKKFFSLIVSLTLILSNLCSFRVFAAEEQQLAVFSYTAPADAVPEDTLPASYGDKDNGYTATSGVLQSSAKLFASVNGTDPRKLEWSKTEYKYGTATDAMVPVMTAGKKNLWGSNPYFEIECSTEGYENIKFSAKVGSSSSGPKSYTLQYSTDKINYIDVTDKAIPINKDLTSNLFDNISVPAVSDKQTVYFKITATNTDTYNGGTFPGTTSGESAINDIIISGTSISASVPSLDEPTVSIVSNPDFIEKDKTYYINYTSAIENPTCFLAGYNSVGRMILCDLNPTEINIPADSEVTEIKVMLWNNLTDLIPLTPAVTKAVK